jgi:hypothetical protein
MKIAPTLDSIKQVQSAMVYDPKAMKAERSVRFENALRQFIGRKGEKWEYNTQSFWAADLMADLKHWCDVNALCYADIERLAASHHRSECDDDQDAMQVGVINSLPPITPH